MWQLTSIGSDNGLAPNRQQAIIWSSDDAIHWRIYAALGGNELIVDNFFIERIIAFHIVSQIIICYYWIMAI